MKNIFLIGGGGHCHSCIDVIEQEQVYLIKGIFDVKENIGKTVMGYPIVGCDEDLKNFISPDHFFLITLGQIKSADLRVKIANELKVLNAMLATVVSPRAYVSKHASIGEGTIILHSALVNSNVKIGTHCIINSQALVEHDSIISNFCHVSTAAIVNGNCKIERESFVGSNCVLREGSIVTEKSVLRAGSFFNGK
ncbi:MAG: NeuD/PglB/VioB family sugar acetyltransferase [Bacteriovorax sp.]|nr:NeuD/PglB/VioB family sugar acetyltransferase [Bacteriovorax sp.]